MTKLEISLPDEERRFVDRRIAQGDFGSVSDYVAELIRRDREAARDRLKMLIDEGLASPSFEANDEWWERKRQELAERIQGMPE